MRCLITGCNGGIGRNLCKTFNSDGYKVYGIDKNFQENEWCDEFLKIDLSDFSLSSIPKKDFDLLINCAAVQIIDDFQKFDIDQIEEVFNVNILSVIKLIRSINFSEDSNIINIGSIHSGQTKTGFSIYSITKGALESLTKSLSVELVPKTRVNMIKPAAIDTSMLKEGLSQEELSEIEDFHPVKEVGNVENVSSLCKEIIKNDFLNGSILSLDGGISNVLHDPSNV